MTEFLAGMTPGQWVMAGGLAAGTIWAAIAIAVFAAWGSNPWRLG